MRITVIVCTWNREALLAETLESLGEVDRPEGVDCETLIVDNGSTDGTPRVAREAGGLDPVRVVREERAGLSRARNRALRECQTDDPRPWYLVWIDDDVHLGPGWLLAYADAFRRWPEAAVFGGPVVPRLRGSPPYWLRDVADRVAHAWSAIDLGPPGRLGPGIDRIPFGANFVVRADAVGCRAFDTALGRTHAGLGRGGEEIHFMESILSDGHEGRWVPDAPVYHQIGAERQTLRYLRAYSWADGYDAELREAHPPTAMRRTRLLSGWLASGAKAAATLPTGKARLWVPPLLEASTARGRLAAACGRAP